jgi:hypothetical protein
MLGSYKFIVLIFICYSFFSLAKTSTNANPLDRLYFRLAGKSLSLRHPHRELWRQMMEAGQINEVASLITKEDSFINQVAYTWGIQYLTAGKASSMELNDALSMVVGIVRDDLDARALLRGDFSYGPDLRLGLGRPKPNTNIAYSTAESRILGPKFILKYFQPQWEEKDFKEFAGLLTSRWWGETYYQGGTNRRSVVGLMNTFLCQPIESWKTSALSTSRIRQDIPRDPSNDPRIFQQECRSCHGPMDGLAGAFAYLDFQNNEIVYNSAVSKKYSNNFQVYPEGYETTDDSWKNFLIQRTDLGVGWPKRTKGMGLKELGEMVIESEGFSRCLAKRTVAHFCGDQMNLTDEWILELAKNFTSVDQFKIRELMIRVVTSPNCQ